MKKEIIINDVCFNSQKAAIEHTRKVLCELESEAEIRPGAKGWGYLDVLIKRHPEYESKKGKGINSIVIKRDYNGNIAMDIKRIDGTIVEISWLYCVKNQAASPQENLKNAMRYAVIRQREEFKRKISCPSPICAICGKAIQLLEQMEVHHDKFPFVDWANAFIVENGTPPTRFDEDPITNQAKFTEADRAYSESWQNFHRCHAIWGPSHSACNRSQGRKTEFAKC